MAKLANSAGKSAMSSAAHVSDLTRSAARALVEREEHRSGSRMAAYEIVASTVGTSASWLREFIGRRAAIDPTGFNILSAYQRLCTRVEQEQQNERAIIASLKERIDAATPGTLELVESTTRAETPGAGVQTDV